MEGHVYAVTHGRGQGCDLPVAERVPVLKLVSYLHVLLFTYLEGCLNLAMLYTGSRSLDYRKVLEKKNQNDSQELVVHLFLNFCLTPQIEIIWI